MPADRIDSHHHFWQYHPDEYGWISDEMARIRRDFLPEDLASAIASAGIDGVVSVQARQSIEETNWLLEMAAEHDFIRGVVGWVPLAHPDLAETLDRLAGAVKLKAVRHVLHDEPDPDYMLGKEFNRGIGALAARGLAYDILIFERHLPQTIEFVDRHPNQVFVLDHIAKPRIRDNVVSPWRENIGELARRENVYCKISGLVTEADWHRWSPAQLRPYIDAVIEAFGPGRLMFGSDWPVCLVACKYERWATLVASAVSELSDAEQALVLGGSAVRAYRL